jgi:tetratricopeptide (TPR) repeat protein
LLAEARWQADRVKAPVRALAWAEAEFARATGLGPAAARRRAQLLHRAWLQRLSSREVFLIARSAYAEAASLDPMNPLILDAAALLELEAGSVERARLLLEQALELEPRFLGARALLVRCLQQLGQQQSAAEQLQRLQELSLEVSKLVPASAYERAVWEPADARLQTDSGPAGAAAVER